MKWLDSRLQEPSTKFYNEYTVVFKYCGSIFVGRAGFLPIDNYTKGIWQETKCSNGNKLDGGEVLYWMENPKVPEWLVK